jgi:hypothetical protein
MENPKMHSDILKQIFASKNSNILEKYRESITTIMLGLDILEDVNDSPKNKDLVQIIRHSFDRIFEIFLEDEKTTR